MIRTIKEVYDLIVEKRDNARQYLEKQNDELYRQGMLGNINAYNDVLSLIESSHLLEEDKPAKGKDLTPLEALEMIKSIELSHMETDVDENNEGEWEYFHYEQSNGNIGCNYYNECKIIEKALKELEEYKEQDIKVCGGSLLTCKTDFETLWKKHKALEIIQSKDFIDLQLLRKCKSAYEYNRKIASKYAERGNDIGLITQEEYDLLKEVLL